MDGSKVDEEASKDGGAHVACGVFEGARLVCDDARRDFDPNDVSSGEPHAFRAYGCGLPADAEVPDAELAAIVLFLERCCDAAEEAGAEPVHAIAAVDSEACLVDVEIAWRLEDARALAPRNRSALLETICALRQRLVVSGGSSRFIWCPAHVGIYGNLAADAVAKAFLYGPVAEPRLHVRRSIHIPTLWSADGGGSCVRAGGDGCAGDGLGATSRGAFRMLPADRKIFRLVRKLLWRAEVQRRLPAALRRRKERAVAEDGAEDAGLEEEAEAEGAQWLGMWPILDPSALGARRADGDAPRWQAVVAASSHGASGGEGTRRRPSAVGLRFMLRSGVPLDGLFGLACCPLCGRAGVPLDVRHVLSGECAAGASAEERAHAAALLRELEAKLPLGADAHEGAGQHDAALTRELRLAARVLGAEGGAVPRGETSDEEWWMAARLASGMPPGLGPGARAAILSEAEAKERAAPEKRKVGMAAAREAAMSGARGDVMGVMDKLAYHLAQVVGSWCGRLAGQREAATGLPKAPWRAALPCHRLLCPAQGAQRPRA